MEFTNTVMFASTGETPIAGHGWATLLTAGLLLSVVSGCALRSPPPRPDLTLQQVTDRGYIAERRYVTSSLRENWNYGDALLDVTFVAPSQPGPFPLIVYLPGLGESATAGSLWRNAWAQAGYAVLTVQPTTLGEALWASNRARAGDFRALAKEQFSQASLETRLKVVGYAVNELTRRATTGIAPYSVADTTRVAVVGFDLGAQTASMLAGERVNAESIPMAKLNLRAAITLSPYIDLAAGGLEQRFAGISIPLLSITGTEDDDPFGVVSSSSLPRAPWRYMPAGDKYLLLLEEGTHALLAGSGMVGKGDIGDAAPGRRDRRASGGFSGDPPGRDMQFGDGPGDGGRSRGGMGQRPEGPGRQENRASSQTFSMKHIAAVQGVSTAFLDATVKGDPIAREWLTRNAARWMGDSATLQIK